MTMPAWLVLIALSISVFWALGRFHGFILHFNSKALLGIFKLIIISSYIITSIAISGWLMRCGIH